MKIKRFLSIALTLAMLVGMLPGMSLTAGAAGSPTVITPSNTSGTMTITLTIAAASVKTAPTENTLTYSGSAQALTTAGEAENGTMQYCLGTDGTNAPTSGFGAEIPKGTEAKDYYVWYRSYKNENNKTDPICVPVTIAAKGIAAAEITLANDKLEVTGSEQTVSIQSVKVGGTTLTAGTDYTVSGNTGTEVGNYTLTVTGNGNYSGAATKAWEITKTQPKLKEGTQLTVPSLTYGQKLSDSAVTGIMVSKTDSTTEVPGTFAWKEPTTAPKVSDSGMTEYDVIFTPTSADYGAVELKTKVTVNAKELTVKADDKTRIAGADSNPELTYTVTGLVGTDTKETVLGGALACAANSSSPAGQTYDITRGTLEVANSNYTIGTFTNGTMTVSLPELKVNTIQMGELTSTTAKLNGSISPVAYATGENVSSVGFKYRKAGASAWESVTGTVGSTFSAEITGLTADSDYEYYAVMTVNGETTEKNGKTITFHTEKAVKTDAGKITVTVAKDNAVTGNPEVVVSVEKGNDVIASKDLGAFSNGNLTATFECLPNGNYNVVTSTKDGDFTETKMLSIMNGEAVTAGFTVLKGKIAAVVEIKEGTDTPKVAVDGLNDILSEDDKKDAADGKKDVKVKLDVEKKAEAGAEGASKIKSLLTSKEEIGMYLDLSIVKTTVDLSSGEKTEDKTIGNKNTKILCIAIPYVFTGRSGFFMARYHDSKSEKMTMFDVKPSGTSYESEGYFLDTTAGYIFLYASGFSTYAIGYEKTGSGSGGGGGGYTPVTPRKTTPAKPSAPVLKSKTDTTITVKAVSGQEYSIDEGKTWQTSGTFTRLTPETEYSIVTKITATSTANESPVSDVLKVTTDKKADSSTPTPTEPGSTTTPTDKPTETPGSTITPTETPGTTTTPGATTAPADKVTKAEKAKAKLSLNAGLKVSYVGKKVMVKWGKVSGADRYVVYAAYCGPDKCTKVGSLSGSKTSMTFTKLNGKKLNQKKNIKVYVVAYREVKSGQGSLDKKIKLARSITAHIVGTKNAKYTNVKKIKLSKSSHTLKVSKTATVKAKIVLVDKKKKQLPDSHAPEFRYVSSNTKVATVDKNGRIKAVEKGTCYIYVYAKNGYAKKIKITVK